MPRQSQPELDLDADGPAGPSVAQRLFAPLTRTKNYLLAPQRRAKAMVLSACGLLLLTGLTLYAKYGNPFVRDLPDVSLDEALAALDEGDILRARRLAEDLLQPGVLPTDELGGPLLIFGATALRESQEIWRQDKEAYNLLAASYLDQARERGFPAGREMQGHYLLAESLFTARRYPQARLMLEECLKTDSPWTTVAHWLMSRAYLEDTPPQFARALEHNSKYLADRHLLPGDRDAGMLQLAEIQLRLGNIEACQQALAQISVESPQMAEVLIMRARLLIRQATAYEGPEADPDFFPGEAYAEAIDLLRQAQNIDRLDQRTARQAMFLIGKCYTGMDDLPAAIEQFHRTYETHTESLEGAVASLEEGRLLRLAGQKEDSIEAYRRAARSVENIQEFYSPFITMEDLRVELQTAYDQFMLQEDYAQAVELAQFVDPVLGETRDAELLGQAYQSWGQKLLESARTKPLEQARLLRNEGRLRLRQAGDAYMQLAELQFDTRRYPEVLWMAVEAYLAGHDFLKVAESLESYTQTEPQRRRPLVLLVLGESLLAQERADEALELLQECIESFPSDAATFRARLLLAQAESEFGNISRARDLLVANLNDSYLSPESQEWQDSLFGLGRLLHLEGRYPEAITRLAEAVERYPESSGALDARYLLAEAYRLEAERLRKAAADPAAPLTMREEQLARANSYRQQCLEQYAELQHRLLRLEERQLLEPLEETLLRNSYFAWGNALVAETSYEEAIRLYTSATNRYQHRPEVLEAYVQIAHCYRALDEGTEARTSLEQAKVVLNRMPEDAPFKQTTNYSRTEWGELLDWLLKI